jgi:hypothetical protein
MTAKAKRVTNRNRKAGHDREFRWKETMGKSIFWLR